MSTGPNEYGFAAADARNRALRETPIGLDVDPASAHHTEKTIPVWVRLHFPSGKAETAKGFAIAWTREAVLVQYVDMWPVEPIWVEPQRVRRRKLEKDRRGR
ncbi:hypothetical protein GCM10027403_14530 [Arthrobacter tecti]